MECAATTATMLLFRRYPLPPRHSIPLSSKRNVWLAGAERGAAALAGIRASGASAAPPTRAFGSLSTISALRHGRGRDVKPSKKWQMIHREMKTFARDKSSKLNVKQDGVWSGTQWRPGHNKTTTMIVSSPPPSPASQRNFSIRRGRTPRMSECRTLEEALSKTHDHLDILGPRDLAAFWTVVPRLLQGRRKQPSLMPADQMMHQFDRIYTHTMEDMASLGHRDLATVALGFAKIMHVVRSPEAKFREGSPHQILRDLLVGQNSGIKQYIFKRIGRVALLSLPEFDARSLSNLVYAYGLAKHVLEDENTLLYRLGAEAIQKLGTFNSQGLSNMLWAYATLDASNPQLFKEAGDNICVHQDLRDFNSQDLSNTVWAYATAEESHPQFFKRLADHIIALDNLDEFKPQALSNTIWAYASAKESHPELFKRLAGHIIALDNLSQFKPQALSNIVWAYATAEELHPQLFSRLAGHIIAIDNLSQFKPQDLSNTVWAYASTKESHPQLFKRLAEHIIALDNLNEIKPQALSIIVWAYATAKESQPRLFKRVAEHITALDNLNEFKPQALSNIAWAYATAEESHQWLFKRLADFAIRKQNEFDSQDIANFLWAFASNGLADEHLFTSFTPKAVANLSECISQGLANIGWAYAVANVDAPSLFNDDFVNACSKKELQFIPDELYQLHQWQLWQEERNSNIWLPPSLREKCHEAFRSSAPEPSALQNDVFAELSSLGLEPEEEVLTKRGYRLDALVETNGEKIGIEVDGPSHFIERKPKGSTILKHRQVSNLDGIPVVSVPYWDWNKLGKDSRKKQHYLRSLLQSVCKK